MLDRVQAPTPSTLNPNRVVSHTVSQPHKLSLTVAHTVSHCLTHCLSRSHTLSLKVSHTVSHGLTHCLSQCSSASRHKHHKPQTIHHKRQAPVSSGKHLFRNQNPESGSLDLSAFNQTVWCHLQEGRSQANTNFEKAMAPRGDARPRPSSPRSMAPRSGSPRSMAPRPVSPRADVRPRTGSHRDLSAL